MATSLKLNYEPVFLRFGTSGRRGLVRDLTQLEIYINVLAEIRYLQSLSIADGGIRPGQKFFLGTDLRPSSTGFDPSAGGRGELVQAVEQAIRDGGMEPVYLGAVPTPAVAYKAFREPCGSIMVTGSHIPFDRNGYKTNAANRELLKSDEAPIQAQVEEIRRKVMEGVLAAGLFNAQGMLTSGHRELPVVDPSGINEYLRRYLDFFGPGSLEGSRLLVYEHSAVGREFLGALLEQLGAQVIRLGRSDTFVPIDTENIDDQQLSVIQDLASEAQARGGPLDAVVSTDGDSDRPLLLGVEDGKVRFYGGDLLGMVVAQFLRADAVVVPISCNDAIDRSTLAPVLQPKTRIGSPYVIAGMNHAREQGKQSVVGWEANGGFLTGSDLRRGERCLRALPTRDAMLPILSVLAHSKQLGVPLSTVFGSLPARFSKAALIRNFPRSTSLQLLARFALPQPGAAEVSLADMDAGQDLPFLRELEEVFSPREGFGRISRINYVDGLRLYFSNGDVAHIRPSGNADELRIYAVADSPERAERIAARGVAEPDGYLRKLASAL